MSTIRTSNFGPLTGNAASVVDPSTPTNGIARVSPLVSFASVASTSGTSIDFTGIPSWARRITVMLQGFSTNGTSLPQIQLGTSSGITTSGYLGSVVLVAASPVSSNFTTGFGVTPTGNWAATVVVHGSYTICLLTGNTWVCTGTIGQSSGGASAFCNITGGSVALSGTLDRVRITTVNGTDTFDAGTISVMYE